MAKLSMIWVWPGMGFEDRFWSGRDPANADENAFYRTSVRVCEIFSEELAKEGIEARSSEVRFFGELGEGPDLTVNVIEGIKEGFECVRLSIPRGVHRLAPAQRGELVARAVEVAVDRLAHLHDWNRDKIKAAMLRARATAFERSWQSNWKSSKDRRWRVRLIGQILDDGYVRLRIEQTSSDGASSLLSDSIRGGTSRRSFLRAAKSMQWGDGALAFHNGAGFSSTTTGRLIVPSETLQSDPVLTEPLQNDMGEGGADIPSVRLLAPPEFQWFCGMGPTDNRTAYYESEFVANFFASKDERGWRDWWTRIGITEVTTNVWFNAVAFKTLIRLTDDRLNAITYRPADSIPEDKEQAREMARSDFAELIERVQARFKLPDPPLTDLTAAR